LKAQACAREHGRRRVAGKLLSHSAHRVLEPFQFTFEVQVFYLVPIQVRFQKFGGINFRAAAVTHRGIVTDVMKLNIGSI
jgi:hypothetical protein